MAAMERMAFGDGMVTWDRKRTLTRPLGRIRVRWLRYSTRACTVWWALVTSVLYFGINVFRWMERGITVGYQVVHVCQFISFGGIF